MAAQPHFLRPLVGIGRDRVAAGLIIAERGVVLAATIELAGDSPSRRRGLRGRDTIGDEHAFVLAPCAAIHTFGMRFAIDVVFTARDGRVLAIRPDVPPRRIAIGWRAFATVELAAGTVATSALRVGETLAVTPRDARAASSR